jgi:hypothetical protein
MLLMNFLIAVYSSHLPVFYYRNLYHQKKLELSVDIKEARDVKKIVIDFPTRIRRPGEL